MASPPLLPEVKSIKNKGWRSIVCAPSLKGREGPPSAFGFSKGWA